MKDVVRFRYRRIGYPVPAMLIPFSPAQTGRGGVATQARVAQHPDIRCFMVILITGSSIPTLDLSVSSEIVICPSPPGSEHQRSWPIPKGGAGKTLTLKRSRREIHRAATQHGDAAISRRVEPANW